MRHFTGLKDKNITTFAIGGFDGMHKAHQKLFEKLDKSGAILVIDNGFANLTPKKYREKFTSHTIYYLTLSLIRDMTGKEFINRLKKMFPNLTKVVVGFDFRFGLEANCGIDDLKLYFKEVIVIDELKEQNIPIHSKTIRQFIQDGNIFQANKMLGRCYEITGQIVSGQGLGATDLVPTINISVALFIMPKDGVYQTTATIDGKKYKAITFVGKRVSTDGAFSIETHIINQEVQNLPKYITINFVSYIRENKKFENLKELKEQIDKDIEFCQK